MKKEEVKRGTKVKSKKDKGTGKREKGTVQLRISN
jgi:hypothetical protein